MLQPSEWRAKAAEYAVKADEITDADLHRQYTELAARCLGVADMLEDVRTMAPMCAGRPGED
jgi:hypothetical protein